MAFDERLADRIRALTHDRMDIRARVSRARAHVLRHRRIGPHGPRRTGRVRGRSGQRARAADGLHRKAVERDGLRRSGRHSNGGCVAEVDRARHQLFRNAPGQDRLSATDEEAGCGAGSCHVTSPSSAAVRMATCAAAVLGLSFTAGRRAVPVRLHLVRLATTRVVSTLGHGNSSCRVGLHGGCLPLALHATAASGRAQRHGREIIR